MLHTLRELHDRFASRAFDFVRNPLLLFFRLYWFIPLVANGWGKLHNLAGVTEFFASLGIPFPAANALFVALLECVGGALLVLGVFSRTVAALMVGNFTVALWTADRDAVRAFFTDQDKFLQAAPTLYWVAALVLLAFGPGRLALDSLPALRDLGKRR